MIQYLIWLPALLFLGFIFGCISKYTNDNPNSWMLWLLLFPNPIWLYVVKVSKSLIFDSMLYDFGILFAYLLAYFCLGELKAFTGINYFGLLLAIIGMFLIKI